MEAKNLKLKSISKNTWARGLVTMSEVGVLDSEWLVRIRTLACGAGDPGFKSPRARHYCLTDTMRGSNMPKIDLFLSVSFSHSA
jgi:hypothetical protein